MSREDSKGGKVVCWEGGYSGKVVSWGGVKGGGQKAEKLGKTGG